MPKHVKVAPFMPACCVFDANGVATDTKIYLWSEAVKCCTAMLIVDLRMTDNQQLRH